MASARLAAWLRAEREVAAPYTRKVFHFAIFTAAGVAQLAWGRPAAVLLGCVVALHVLYAVARGAGHPFFEALARPSDAPRRALFVLLPLGATAVGGVLSNLLFPTTAEVGYLACGWGDAVGEPVGVRWGRHQYGVPSLAGVPAVRSLEGSTAVALAGGAASGLGLAAAGTPMGTAAAGAAVLGVVTAGVEAISHHGLDNLTLQVTVAGAATLLA